MMARPAVVEALLVFVLGILAASHVYVQNYEVGSALELLRQYIEAFTLALLIVAGAMLGAHYSRRLSRSIRPVARPAVVEALLVFVLGILAASHVYVQNYEVGSALELLRQYIEAFTLALLIVAGAMLGAHYSRRLSRSIRPVARPAVVEALLVFVLGILAASHVYVQNYEVGSALELLRQYIEAFTLALLIVAGAMLGAHYSRRLSRSIRPVARPAVVEALLVFVLGILAASHVYVQNYEVGSALELLRQYIEAFTLALLIVAGAMLGAHYSRRLSRSIRPVARPAVVEALLVFVLGILAASHVYVQNYEVGSALELLRQYIEAFTLALLIVAGAMLGAHYSRRLSRSIRPVARPAVVEALLVFVLGILAASHVYVQNYEVGSALELLRQYIEAFTLALLIVAGAMLGAHYSRRLSRSIRPVARPAVVEALLVFVLGILAASHVYVQNYEVGSALELLRQYIEAFTLALLIVAGAMLGAHYSRRISYANEPTESGVSFHQ